MFALVDCNSFFCSVEKVFHPGLKNKPVVVLSSNDGCIVALTPEAKAVGLHRGDPIFKVKDIVVRNKVHIFSSNMMLYAAMSKRIVNIMRSKFAKEYAGYHGVAVIDTDEKRRKALAVFPLDDVWGIGRQTLSKLHYYGIHTPLDFADKSESWVRSHLQKPGQQTWYELNGKPCIDTAESTRRKSICTSRTFGEMITDFDSLKASVATFASSCASKLRGQQSGARSVTVFIASNRFREDLPQYNSSATTTLLVPSNDTLEITQAAVQALKSIYRQGIHYKRSGVILNDIHPSDCVEGNLFDTIRNRPERAKLMQAIDKINHRYGLKTVKMAAEGEAKQAWTVKSDYRSGDYLTDINDLLTIGDND